MTGPPQRLSQWGAYEDDIQSGRRRATKALVALSAALMLSTTIGGVMAAQPDYYPADYAGVIEASHAEKGVLV